MPMRPSMARLLHPDPDRKAEAADLHKAVRGAVRRAHERRAGITSIETARRDRRAKAAGTLDDVRALEDTVLSIVEDARDAVTGNLR